ncbi:hypothetical protein [Microbacterium sp. A94]|uniref:arsenate reductase/protein-tyrosine-phosphatase family protein n=1 Tax=Microbacterium sp. A94 TaxID=3450717 RepID=UPI003F43D58B
MNDESILVVCAANVCRSSLAELLLKRGLDDSIRITVSSAGMRANDGDRICTMVAELHNDDDGWREQAGEHRTSIVTAESVENAGLVLGASREIRGDLVRLSPVARDRAFTIKEAAYLGRGFIGQGDVRVVEYLEHLDRARARTTPLTAAGSNAKRLSLFSRTRRNSDPMSIADRHGGRGHRETLAEVETAIGAIVAQLNGDRRRVH